MDYKKVLLLHFTQGLSGRSIAEVTGVSKSAINDVSAGLQQPFFAGQT